MFSSQFPFIVALMFSIFITHRVLSFQKVVLGISRFPLNPKWSSPLCMTLTTKTGPPKDKPKKIKTNPDKDKPTKIKYPKLRPGEESRVKPQPKLEDIAAEKDRPFTLPPGLYRPKQSLGQNFLSDQNYVVKIINAFSDSSEKGRRVLEIGPGAGALTRKLFEQYPEMTAVEVDQRGVEFLGKKLPGINIIHMDILDYDWAQAAVDRGGPLSVIANLPYNLVSQVIFMLADNHKAISKAVLTMQLEVGERVTAVPNTKEYGIPSVVLQLYGTTKLNFQLPPKVFYPVPKVDSALVTIDFTKPHPDLHKVDGDSLRKVVTLSFQHRRKMLRASLRDLCEKENLIMPEKWTTLRPEQLKPSQFLELTADLYGERTKESIVPLVRNPLLDGKQPIVGAGMNRDTYTSTAIWRKAMFPNMTMSNKQKAKLEKIAALTVDGESSSEKEDNVEGEEEEKNTPEWKKERELRKAKRSKKFNNEQAK